MITMPQEKLSCIKVGATTILKFQQEIIPILNRDIENFRWGNLKNHLTKWENVTSDKIILDIIKIGLKLDVIDTPKSNSKFTFPLSHEEKLIVKKEVALLKGKNIVAKANVTENNTFVSGVFTRSKKDGSKRMILNLKRLNKFVDYKHFKMESLQNVLELIRPGVYMASIDLKDAFYSAPVHKNQQAYLKFFVEEYLKFVCMPNGYGPAVRIFTKISKTPFSILREIGFLSVVYVDGSYLQRDCYEDCFSIVLNTIEVIRSLGFTIIPEKSKFIPTQCIAFFGFILNSVQMAITWRKQNSGEKKILNLCHEILKEDVVTTRFLSKHIGNLVLAFPEVTLGSFYYWALEMDKAETLQLSNGNYDASVRLPN